MANDNDDSAVADNKRLHQRDDSDAAALRQLQREALRNQMESLEKQ